MKLLQTVPKPVIRTLQISLMLGLFVLLWRTMDGREALRILLEAKPVFILAAALALTLQTILSALRWRVTAGQLGIPIPVLRALREYYLAQFVNQSLPGGVVGDAGRAVRSREQAGLAVAAQAVVFERLAGQIGLLAVFLVVLPLSFLLPASFTWPAWLLNTVLISLSVLAMFALFVALMMRRSQQKDHAVRRFFSRLVKALAAREVVVWQVILSLGTALLNITAFALCALALGVSLPLLAVAALVPIILVSMLLPLTIGGWGVREGAAALLFPVAGATAAQGLATSVAFGLVIAVAVLPGLAVTWLAGRGQPRDGKGG